MKQIVVLGLILLAMVFLGWFFVRSPDPVDRPPQRKEITKENTESKKTMERTKKKQKTSKKQSAIHRVLNKKNNAAKKTEVFEQETEDSGQPERPNQMVYPISRQGIDDAMRVFIPNIRECYQQFLRKHPQAEGRILVAFTIEENTEDVENSDIAKISNVEILESELDHEDVENCMMDNLDQLWFEPPENGSTEVRYPFFFSY